MDRGGERREDSQNLSHLYSSINYRCFHASSFQTLTITLSPASRILYFGVMNNLFAVTLAVLGPQLLQSVVTVTELSANHAFTCSSWER